MSTPSVSIPPRRRRCSTPPSSGTRSVGRCSWRRRRRREVRQQRPQPKEGLSFLDGEGYPTQWRGVTPISGLSILSLDWLHTAGSGIFAGIGEDAAYLAAHITGHLVAS